MVSEEFVNGLKRDKARGSIAPHQIILLLSLLNIYLRDDNINYDIIQLNSEFRKVWNDYKNKFTSKNCNIGLPLKVFVNRGYVDISVLQPIKDFRSKKELESKISAVIINGKIVELFKDTSLKMHLISRIDK